MFTILDQRSEELGNPAVSPCTVNQRSQMNAGHTGAQNYSHRTQQTELNILYPPSPADV